MTPDAADIFEFGYPLHDPKSRQEMEQLFSAQRYPKPHCPTCRTQIPPHKVYVLRNPLQRRHSPNTKHDLHLVMWCDTCSELMTANVCWLGDTLKITSTWRKGDESILLRKGEWGRLQYEWYLWRSKMRHGHKAVRPDEG